MVVTVGCAAVCLHAVKTTVGPNSCLRFELRLVVLPVRLPCRSPPTVVVMDGGTLMLSVEGPWVASVSTHSGSRLLEQSRRTRLPVAPARFPALPQ